MVRYHRSDRAAYHALSASQRAPLDRVATRIQAQYRGYSRRGHYTNPYIYAEWNRMARARSNIMYERQNRQRRNERLLAGEVMARASLRHRNEGINHNLGRVQSFL